VLSRHRSAIECGDSREFRDVDLGHPAELLYVSVLDADRAAVFDFRCGIPVREGEPPALVAEDAAQDVRLAVAAIDRLSLALEDADLDGDRAVTGPQFGQLRVATALVGHLEGLLDEGQRGALAEIEFGFAVPLADARVARGDRVARREAEVLPRGVVDDAGLVGQSAFDDDVIGALIADRSFARGQDDARDRRCRRRS